MLPLPYGAPFIPACAERVNQQLPLCWGADQGPRDAAPPGRIRFSL